MDDLSSRPSFGYLPDRQRLDAVLGRGNFGRALVITAPVTELVEAVHECRFIWKPEVQLPQGLYWFEGSETESIIMQVYEGTPPGGALLALADELDDDHPLVSARAWAEELWSVATPVPAPAFQVNEAVVTHPGGHDASIRKRKFLGFGWTYTAVVGGRQQDIIESHLRPLPQLDDPTTWIRTEPTPAERFGATLTRAKLQGKFSNTLFSFRATRTSFRPYQFKPVLKLLQTGKARLLIADEVGLGKTIEAGLIWTELEARREADRVLVVCPSSLLGKWKEEMQDRFEFELVELDNKGLQSFLERHGQNRLPARQAYICSLERLRAWAGLLDLKDYPPAFDLVIVDEAHSMRNQDTRSYALGSEISEWADNLVFLTATPINLRHEDLLSLLELLAPEDYGDLHDLEMRLEPNRVINAVAARLVKRDVSGRALAVELSELRGSALGRALTRRPEFQLLGEILERDALVPRDIVEAKRYLADLNTLSTVITRTKKVEVDDRKAKRQENRQTVQWTSAEIQFYEEYVKWCRKRAAAMHRPLYFAMQMPLRLASACLPMARRAVLDPPGFGDLTDADSEIAPFRLEPHDSLIQAAESLPSEVDSKFDLLRAVLADLLRQDKRSLIFTHSRPTIDYLRQRLAPEFRVAVMHGGVSRDSRREIMGRFRNGAFDVVLANRVASEGLDFEFCSAVINYDLPWNPMEIEQRIGRIDRIGQFEEKIQIINFVNELTIDEKILCRLLDRIRIFESSIGALEPIIAEQAPLALRAGLDFSLTEEQRNQEVHEVLTAMEEQQLGLQEVADASSGLLVANDVDVAGLEEDLLRTGRYIGQLELALLLDDWARIDESAGLRFSKDRMTVELTGNSRMAERIEKLSQQSRRTRSETAPLAGQLRSELPIPLVLDQELARVSGGVLLTSTSPLVMAATEVPGHHLARFSSLRLTSSRGVLATDTYVVVLAKAVAASRGGDEIWGAAVTTEGHDAGEDPVDALLAALAMGQLTDAPLPKVNDPSALAERAMNLLHLRHFQEQHRRDREFGALQSSRIITLQAQHERRLATIRQRIATAEARGRDPRAIALFNSQITRAEARFRHLSDQLGNATLPEVRLEPLAVCFVTID